MHWKICEGISAAFFAAVWLSMLPYGARGNSVTNGGFETGDLTGWTVSGNSGGVFVSSVPAYVHSGNYFADFNATGSLAYISQSIATNSADSYSVSFWLDSDGRTPNEFSASFGGQVLMDQTNVPSLGYVNYNFVVTAASSSALLQFGGRDDPGHLSLDDVSVSDLGLTAAPLPSAAWSGVSLLGALGCAVLVRRRRIAAQ